MQTMQFREKVGSDGVLRLEISDLPSGQEIEAVVVVQWPTEVSDLPDASSSWVDELYGSCADAPIERPAQGDWPIREELL